MNMKHDALRQYYASPGIFTSVGDFGAQVEALPDDVATLAGAVQNVLIHRFWAQGYGVEVPPERDTEQGLHSADAMLRRAMQLDAAPIGADRPPSSRVFGICRHFSTMLAAFLRHKGVPSRARCGFATYFEPGKYVDHWICEYWDRTGGGWRQVDAQLDALQLHVVKPDFDPLDVPRDRFLVAGDVWRKIGSGEIDGNTCGIAEWWGDWYAVGNLTLDVASLQKVELLPWEPFGVARAPGSSVADEDLSLVQRIAELTATGDDASIADLLRLANDDARLRPPDATLEAARRADAEGPVAGNPIAVD